MTTLRDLLNWIEPALAWLPPSVVGLAMLSVAVLGALLLQAFIARIADRLVRERHPFLSNLAARSRGPARLALVIIAVRIALPAAPFDPGVVLVFGRLLSVSIVALMGWIAIIAIEIAASFYLRRFRIDVEDNLLARKHVTQVQLLKRTVETMVVIITLAAGLMVFDAVRQYGVSLFASAGAAGLVLGFAARPVLSNLIAGVQLAVTQPIRIDDAVIVENEWGWIEEITATYVVIRVWDWRRLVVPLSHFIEKPFQNWTREGSSLIGTAFIYVDYRAPVDRIREQLSAIVKASSRWDGRVINLQVTDAKERTLELRCLASAASAGLAFELRCEIREKLVAFLQKEHPEALPRERADLSVDDTVVALAAANGGSAKRAAPRREASKARNN